MKLLYKLNCTPHIHSCLATNLFRKHCNPMLGIESRTTGCIGVRIASGRPLLFLSGRERCLLWKTNKQTQSKQTKATKNKQTKNCSKYTTAWFSQVQTICGSHQCQQTWGGRREGTLLIMKPLKPDTSKVKCPEAILLLFPETKKNNFYHYFF